jgi:hypothetical protein
MGKSQYLSSLNADEYKALEQRLLDRQGGKCFICDDRIDLILHQGQLDVDHIDPLAEDGLDAVNNFALTHQSCNRSKGASDLRVARRLAEFDKLQRVAQESGKRGANLGDVLARYDGAKANLRLRKETDHVEFALSSIGNNRIRQAPFYEDKLSGMQYFFTVLPLEYIHHDDRINPRSIGANVRGLLEEFLKKRPQLHVGLAWWAPEEDGSGPVKLFDGQHKAAAQILLGVRELPVRVFVEPDTQVLLQANTNAAGKLRQVAFDTAVMRHLGSTLYLERVRRYQSMRGLSEEDYSFSESSLVRFFRGEQREMERYIIDAQRDAITHNGENRLLEFVEWSGKSADRPLSYSAIEKTFFRDLLYKKALDTPIDAGIEQGTNPRFLERDQMVKLMGIFADAFFVGKWDPDIGGRKLENRLQKGESIPEEHLRAWRIAREEVLLNVVRWVQLVLENYFAFTGQLVHKDRLLHARLPDELWRRIESFFRNLAGLPCWFDKNLATTVFGPKQSPEFWEQVFETGTAPNGIRILAQGMNLSQMIQEKVSREAAA